MEFDRINKIKRTISEAEEVVVLSGIYFGSCFFVEMIIW